jgi:PRTRC genetic system protein B
MDNTYNPLCAIVVYQHKESHEVSFYLEERIYNEKVKAFGAAAPLGKDTYEKIALSIKDDAIKSGIKSRGLIDNLLSINYDIKGTKLVWKVKAGPRKLFFDKSLKIKNDTYYIPHLIFVLNGDILNVYSSKTYNIKDNTKLYKAPFHNISANGSVCMGNAKGDSKLEYIEDIMESWEEAFFNSTFTHFNDSKATKLNLAKTLRASKKTKKFDNNALAESNTKLENIL